MPRIASPDESGFPTIESTITVYHIRLLLHRGQGGGNEALQDGAAATHMDTGMFGRRGARH